MANNLHADIFQPKTRDIHKDMIRIILNILSQN